MTDCTTQAPQEGSAGMEGKGNGAEPENTALVGAKEREPEMVKQRREETYSGMKK